MSKIVLTLKPEGIQATKGIHTFFFRFDITASYATSSQWKKRGFEVQPGSSPAKTITSGPHKTEYHIFHYSTLKRLRGKKAKDRRNNFLQASGDLNRLKETLPKLDIYDKLNL